MNSSQLDRFRIQLTGQIASGRTAPPPLAISPWVAMSLLQKSIRRGRTKTALQAAATLHHHAPDRLWRRIGGAAFEDVGLGSVEVMGMTTAVLAGKRARAAIGEEWDLAAFMVEILCNAPKSRGSDDLYMALETLPALRQKRRDFLTKSNRELRWIALNSKCLHARALALLYLLGTTRPGGLLGNRVGEPELAFDTLDELGVSPTLVAVCREGQRRTGELLAPLVALLALQDGMRDGQSDDLLPAETIVGGIPCWAFDMFTREGKRALTRLLSTNSGVSNFARANVPTARQINFLGHLVFRIEGGALQRRVRGRLADRLHTQFKYETLGIKPSSAEQALDLMREALPLLHQLRAEVVEGGHRE